jgi:hypothetical protein
MISSICGCRLGDDGCRLGRAVEVGADGDRRQAVAAPDQARFERVLETGDLAERNALAAPRRHRKVGQGGQLAALLTVAPQDDVDGLLALAVAGDGESVERHVEQRGDILAGDAEQARLVLIDFDRWTTLESSLQSRFTFDSSGLPRSMVATSPAIRRRVRILAGDAVLERVADRRAVFDAGDVAAHPPGFIFEQIDQSTAQGLARLLAAGHDDQLADIGGGQLLIERKEVARRSRSRRRR